MNSRCTTRLEAWDNKDYDETTGVIRTNQGNVNPEIVNAIKNMFDLE